MLLEGRKMNGNAILKGMIETYQNDFMCGYKGEDKEELRLIFLELIVEVTRYVNNYRYCSNKDCSCSPEQSIALLVKRHEKEINKIFAGGFGLSEVPLGVIRQFLNEFKTEQNPHLLGGEEE
jgi:hypothetical protein